MLKWPFRELVQSLLIESLSFIATHSKAPPPPLLAVFSFGRRKLGQESERFNEMTSLRQQ